MKLFKLLTLLIVLSACNQQPKHPQAELINRYSSVPETDQSILQYADSVDSANYDVEKYTSLVYQSDNSSLYVEKLMWNGNTNLYAEHQSNEGIADKTTKYYLKKDTLILIKEDEKKLKEQGSVFEQKRTYLRNNIPFKTENRIAKSFSELQKIPFKETGAASEGQDYTGKIRFLNDALSGQNKFEMVFDHLISSPQGQYLLLKSKTPGGYSSSLLVRNTDPLIDSLIKEPALFKDTKLNIGWEIIDNEAVYVPVAASVTSANGLKR